MMMILMIRKGDPKLTFFLLLDRDSSRDHDTGISMSYHKTCSSHICLLSATFLENPIRPWARNVTDLVFCGPNQISQRYLSGHFSLLATRYRFRSTRKSQLQLHDSTHNTKGKADKNLHTF